MASRPKRRSDDDLHESLANRERHPAFGTIRFDRCQGGGHRRHLFGSPIERHYNFIRMTVHRASNQFYLAHDQPFGEEQILELDMSEAQFAQLLTTMNFGHGACCTLRFVTQKGEGIVEAMPERPIEVKKVKDDFKKNISDVILDMRDATKRAEEICGKSRVTAAEREEMKSMFKRISDTLESSAPFVIDQFNEASERVVKSAQAEVDAFVHNVIQQTGLKALKMKTENEPLRIMEEKEDG